MIIYSVTISVEHPIEGEWLEWMQTKHIPDVMATGYFLDYQMHKVLEPLVDPEATNYNILYHLESRAQLDAYQTHAAAALQKEHQAKFGSQAVAFRSLLERLTPLKHE